MVTTHLTPFPNNSEQEYKRRVWAWTMYDWANSAFATTILANVEEGRRVAHAEDLQESGGSDPAREAS